MSMHSYNPSIVTNKPEMNGTLPQKTIPTIKKPLMSDFIKEKVQEYEIRVQNSKELIKKETKEIKENIKEKNSSQCFRKSVELLSYNVNEIASNVNEIFRLSKTATSKTNIEIKDLISTQNFYKTKEENHQKTLQIQCNSFEIKKKDKRLFLDINQSTILQDPLIQKSTYPKQIQSFIESEGKVYRTQFYRFLLLPEQEQFRKDFLVASPWMSFLQKAKKSKKTILEKEMIAAYSNPHCSLKQKKMLLQFATELIKRKIFSQKQICQFKQLIEKEENVRLMSFTRDFLTAIPTPLSQLHDIHYQFIYPTNLKMQFHKIAKGKMKELICKQDRNFIQDLAKDLAAISFNNFKTIHHTEFYHQAWSKNKSAAPNLVNYTYQFNQLSDFVRHQILSAKNLNERDRLYTAFIKIAKELKETHHDYSSAMSIVSTLSSSNLIQVVSKKVAQSSISLEEFFSSTNNFKSLRKEIDYCLSRHIPCVPYVGNFLSDFTFSDDGNSDMINKKGRHSVNFTKMELLAKIHHKIEHLQKNITLDQLTAITCDIHPNLHYNLIDELFEGHFFNDEIAWERNNEIRHRKSL